MPRLVPYTQQITPEGTPDTRRATGDAFGKQSAEALIELGQTGSRAVGVLQEQEDRRDIGNVHAAIAKARADWTVHFKQRAEQAPLGDSTFRENFDTDLQNYIAEQRNTVQTAAGLRVYDQLTAQFAADFSQRAGLWQAESAALKATENYKLALNMNRQTVYSDPTQFDAVLREAKTILFDPHGPYAMLPEDKRQALVLATREELALSAARGVIEMNPKLALTQLQGERWSSYLDADKRATLVNEAQTAVNALEVDERRATVEAERKLKEEQEQTRQGFVEKWSKRGLTAKEVIASNLDAKDKEHYVHLIDQQNKPKGGGEPKTDPKTFYGLLRRIHLDHGDPNKISDVKELEARLAKGLEYNDFVRLRNELFADRDPNGQPFSKAKARLLQSVERELSKTTLGTTDPEGVKAAYEFSRRLDAQIEEYRKAGKDPWELLDPQSSNFARNSVQRRSPVDVMREQAESLRNSSGGLKPGDVKDWNGKKFKYKGGPPGKQDSWEPVSAADAPAAAPQSVKGTIRR